VRVLVQSCATVLALLAFASSAFAGSIRLAWDPSPSSDVAGYIVVYGTTSGNYTRSLDAGNQTSAIVRGLAGGQTYYFAILAYTSEGGISLASNEVSGSTTNAAPILQNPGKLMSGVGDVVSFQLSASDPDGDSIFYDTSGLLGELHVNHATGVISGTLTAASAGTYSISALASDGNVTVEQVFTWTVITTDRSPVMSVIPAQITPENTPVSLTVSASDPDGDELTFAATGLPPGLTIDSESGAIGGSTASIAGIYPVIVTASDGMLTASRAFTWKVDGAAPVLAAIPDQTSSENTTVSLAVSATDADGDALTFGATGLPPGLTIGSSSGIIGGPLSYTSAGTYNVTVTATDGVMTSSQSFAWTVINVNRPPVLASIGHLSTLTGTVVAIQASATDPDGDPVTYSAVDLPAGVTIDANTGVLSGAPAANVYSVTVSASDGTLSASKVFVWTVTAPSTGRVTFMQARSSAVRNTTSSVSVAYPAAQTAGSLNVVVVNWDDPTVLVWSVTDSNGRTYQATGPPVTRPEIGNQSIYYASNVAAAAPATNVVTVTFGGLVGKAEARVAEYQGIEPTNVIDVIAGAQGNSAEANSGSATTTFRNDLLFGAVWSSWDTATSPEGGLTARLTTPSGTLLEDATVTAVGSYSVGASITPPNPWIIQMVAFRDTRNAPVLNNPGSQLSLANATVSLPLVANNIDGYPLTFSATGLPPGLSINPATGVISGQLPWPSAGLYNITATVTDDGPPTPLSNTQVFSWTVTGPAITSSAISFNPGSQVTVSWSGIQTPSATDWIGLFAAGAPDGVATFWYTGGGASGSRAVIVPTTLAAGAYEFRLFAQGSLLRLAVSARVMVGSAALIANSSSGVSGQGTGTAVGVGATITATWSGIGSPSNTDWMALVPTGASDANWLAQWKTTGTASGSMNITLPTTAVAGTYELRLFAQGSFRRLAVSNPITVLATILMATPAVIIPGDTVTAAWLNIGAPTAKDWFTIVPTGGAENAYVAWAYTTGTGSGSSGIVFPKWAAPGTYELRLYSNDTWKRLGVSNSFTVPAPTLTIGPTTVAPGGTLTVTWEHVGQPFRKDWFSLNPVGAADANWLASTYGSGQKDGSIPLTLPANLPPGDYNVRMYSNDTFKRLAISNTITVTASGATLGVTPVAPAPGGTLTVSWRNIAAPTATDWVGVYSAGAADTNYVSRTYTSGRATDHILMTLPANISTGAYELRLFSNNSLTRLATSNPFEVAPIGLSVVGPGNVPRSGKLTFSWTGIPSPTPLDWVALVTVGPLSLDANWWASTNTTGTASGSKELTLPPNIPSGVYELRLFANNGWQRLAVANYVYVGPTLSVTPATVAPGGTVTMTWTGIVGPTPTDWVSMNPLNNNDHLWVASETTTGTASGSRTFIAPYSLSAGTYDLRLYANNSFTRLALSNLLTITAPGPYVSANVATTTSTGTVTASYGGIADPRPNDWIGVYAVGSADNAQLAQVATGGHVIGSVTILLPGLPPGQYELRLFEQGTLTRLAVGNPFTIQ
jgi:putative Ig domain-containing protein/fibronectin type III domain protein